MPNYKLTATNTVQLPEFQEVTDQYGMIQIDGSTSDNGCLFTAHYVYGLIAKNILTNKEKSRIIEVYRNNFLEKGLLARSPGNRSSEAQDDAYAVMSVEAMLFPDPKDRLMTKEMYEYGLNMTAIGVDTAWNDPLIGMPVFVSNLLEKCGIKKAEQNRGWLNKVLYNSLKILGFGKVRWNWNQEKPRMFESGQWLGRFPQFVANLQMTHGKFVTPWRWLWWVASMLSIVYKPELDNMDSYTLRIHMAKACENYGPLTRWVCNKVRDAVKRDFGDFGTVCYKYFGPKHPLVALLRDIV